DMVQKTLNTLIQALLPIAAAATFACSNGCNDGLANNNGNNTEDDLGPYTEEDFGFDCYALEGTIQGEDPNYTSFEGTEVKCDFIMPENFKGRIYSLIGSCSMDHLNVIDHNMSGDFSMRCTNRTILENGEEIVISGSMPFAEFGIKDDPYVGTLNVRTNFDPVYLNNQPPTSLNPDINLGLYEVGQPIDPLNLLEEGEVEDREDYFNGLADYTNNLKCKVIDGEISGVTVGENCEVNGYLNNIGEQSMEVIVVDPQGDESNPISITVEGYQT
ncbi:MAG: hypothetical protein ABH849_01165, partial [Nanoarchaeota archaeon]